MHEPAPKAPTAALVDQIRTRCHDPRRGEPPALIALARKVETAPATAPDRPRGLSHPLAALGRIAAIRHGFRLPVHAGRSWRRLRDGHDQRVADVGGHIHLENGLPLPRFEARA